MIINNAKIASSIQQNYTAETLETISSLLDQHQTLAFHPLKNGLYPAAAALEPADPTGYSYIWVRDNIFIAYAHYVTGQKTAAVKTATTLMQYFQKHRHRFKNIISGKTDPSDPMQRPQVRFDGNTLSEVDQKWAHAQNDALGYFLWLYCILIGDHLITPDQPAIHTLRLFIQYFQKIAYWHDADSGHWEENRKISASSIGTVVAGLEQYQKLRKKGIINSQPSTNPQTDPDSLETLIAKGREALENILPYECRQTDPQKERRYDAALLFLIYPLNIIDSQTADTILHDITSNLQGEYGIKRYIGDSYWAADYKEKIAEHERTADFSDRIEQRNQLHQTGREAQWCIFDPIISVIHGIKYAATRDPKHKNLQTHHLNRSLGQLTSENHPRGSMKCPESYYLERGRYVPSDIVPLLWTQSNLMLALHQMKVTSRISEQQHP